MDAAHIFKTGQSQAVSFSKEYRLTESEVAAQHFGSGLLLSPKSSLFTFISASLASFEPDLQLIREQPEQQGQSEIAS